MSTLVGLFYAKVILTIMVSNYTYYKNVSSESNKQFPISKRSILHLDGLLTNTATQSRSGPGSDGNKEVTLYFS